ncbi:MAG TPA: MBL fold metallo-hydrolase [Desulfobulbaceae bacterium]|nr:MBL fold metallo-hydrolase [Desulfobulbaceae bacterium]
MATCEIAKGVYWVGAIDWDVRSFHGYSTNRGTTYNAYLIVDEKVTLIDCVKAPFFDEQVRRIKEIIDPAKIDYLIVNHVEMDHSGGLPRMMELIKPEKLFCSPMGQKAIIDHFHREDWPFAVVKTGDDLSLGQRRVQFLETRMLHWPDSMFTYLQDEKILFSSDAFGEHYASSERFDDQVNLPVVMEHCAKYYANILYPYSPLVQKLLQTVASLKLDIKMIAPDHGIIWRDKLNTIIEAYDAWSSGKCADKALVIFNTMWHSTEKMAQAVMRGLEDTGVPTELLNLDACHRSDVMTEILRAKGVVLGSSTINNGLLPEMAGFISYMKGLKPFDKIGATFGSFGWSGEAVGLLTQAMTDLHFTLVDDSSIKHKYVPTQQALDQCAALGKRVGEAINNH